jgi:hypothetical protein
MEADLKLLDDWRGLDPAERERLAAHGDRVKKYAGAFW